MQFMVTWLEPLWTLEVPALCEVHPSALYQRRAWATLPRPRYGRTARSPFREAFGGAGDR